MKFSFVIFSCAHIFSLFGREHLAKSFNGIKMFQECDALQDHTCMPNICSNKTLLTDHSHDGK